MENPTFGVKSSLFFFLVLMTSLLLGVSAQAGVLVYHAGNTCMPSNRVHSLVSDGHGGFFAAVDGGAVSFRGTQIEPLALPDEASRWCVTGMVSRGSELYLSTENRGLWCRRAGKWFSATREQGQLPVSGANTLALLQIPGQEKGQSSDYLFLGTDAGPGMLALPREGSADALKIDSLLIPAPDAPSDPVNCLWPCDQGIWVGTMAGAYLYMPGKGVVRRVTASELTWPCVNSIVTSDNRVWFATDRALVRLLGDEFRIYDSNNSTLPPSRIMQVTPLSDGVLVVTSSSVHRISREVFKEYDFGSNPGGHFTGALLLTHTDGSDDLWVSTMGSGLIRHCQAISSPALARRATRLSVAAPGDSPRVEYTAQDGLPGDRITSIAVDNDSFSGRKLIWVGTDSGPVSFDGTMFTLYGSETTGLRDSNVTSLQVAGPPGYRFLWVATRTAGLARYDGSTWKIFAGTQGPGSDTVYSISLSERGIWAGTHAGASWLGQDGIWTRYSRENGLVSDKVYSVATAPGDGGIWFATELGLSHFREGRFTSYNQWDGLPGFRFISLLPLSDREVWIGSYRDGAVCWDGRDFTTYDRHRGLDGKRVNSLIIHNGTVLAATDSGVYSFSRGRFEKKDFRFSGEALSMASDGAYVWVGTQAGLYRFLSEESLDAER